MTDPRWTFQFLAVPTAVALIITALIAYFLGRRLELWPAVLIAGLALPVAMLGKGIYHAATAGSDDAPGGLILIAALGLAAAASPVTLIVSRLAVGYARS
jgi:hypothetical protein